jgi:hypothetical protein
MNTLVQKIFAGLLVVALALAGLPLGSARAAGAPDVPTPAAPAAGRADARLARVFARQNRIIERLGRLYADADQSFPKIQGLLDKARARGLDVSQIQSALDGLKTALGTARPFYDQARSTAAGHNGFDAGGAVTDAQAAKATVQSVHDSLAQFRSALDGSRKALREAIRNFRSAHPRMTPTPAGTSG